MEGKKLRLFRDLREVNKCLVKPKIRYEDLQSLISEVFEEGFWFFTWDLKSCCHHVDIFHPFWALRRISRELLDILPLMFTHWIEHRMFMFYQAFAHFSKEMAADIPQLFCAFR